MRSRGNVDSMIVLVRDPAPALRIQLRPSPEQRRALYLGTRRAAEEYLAREWRRSQSTCARCGYRRGGHAIWCED